MASRTVLKGIAAAILLRTGSKEKEWGMIAVKEKVTFERFTLDFYITLQTYQGRLVGLIGVLLIAALLSYQ